jgi:hypothetical protein
MVSVAKMLSSSTIYVRGNLEDREEGIMISLSCLAEGKKKARETIESVLDPAGQGSYCDLYQVGCRQLSE